MVSSSHKRYERGALPVGKWVSGEPVEARGQGGGPSGDSGAWASSPGLFRSHPSLQGAASSQTFTLLTPGTRRQWQVEVSPSPAPKKGRRGCRPGPRG